MKYNFRLKKSVGFLQRISFLIGYIDEYTSRDNRGVYFF
ncbi:hypothetical protein M094_1549 [Bacteroides uniformis str. 3978 T3 ii]|uniref:Uncharacterized protein n=1 Tax=Bacteroides uniformis str. 3978 T3 ii TaxID=1339349 RepID=A0A078RZ77_BACUN|nr:hypothetical protein M094_1549 [Bacteroides uniformis str. 3978 T3 ii]